MKVLVESLGFVGAFAVVSIACYGMAFSAYASLCGVPLAIVALLCRPRHQVASPMSKGATVFLLVLGFLFVAFMIWSANSGFTRQSNQWFLQSQYRPWLSLGIWAIYVTGLVSFFSHRIAAANSSQGGT